MGGGLLCVCAWIWSHDLTGRKKYNGEDRKKSTAAQLKDFVLWLSIMSLYIMAIINAENIISIIGVYTLYVIISSIIQLNRGD